MATQNHEETARLFLQLARAEQNARMRLRDGLLLAFVATVGAIFGYTLTKDVPAVENGVSGTSGIAGNALFVVPYLAFGVAVLLAQHSLSIEVLKKYQMRELARFLGHGNESPQLFEEWLDSEKSECTTLLGFTSFGHGLMLVPPSVLALILMPRTSDWLYYSALGIGGVLTACTAVLLWKVFELRHPDQGSVGTG